LSRAANRGARRATKVATIHAAIIREIKAKGAESRLQKVGRGQFAAAKHAGR
jgi:hypothetical protein